MEDKQIKKLVRVGVRAHAHDDGGHGKLDAAWCGVGHPRTGDHRQRWAASLRLAWAVWREPASKKDGGWREKG